MENNIADMKPGQKGTIAALNCTGHLRRRLLDMGVLPGQEIMLEKLAPLGDPLEIRVKGYRLSLRRNEALAVAVEVRQ